MRSPLVHLSRWSVQRRITATVAALVTVVLVAVGGTVWIVESRRIDASVEASLTQEIGEFRTLQADDDPETGTPFTSSRRLMTVFLERNLPDTNEALFGFGPSGDPFYQGDGDPRLRESPEFAGAVEGLRTTGGSTSVSIGGHEYRIAVQPVADAAGESAFVVTHDLTEAHADLRDLMTTYALIGALSLIVVAGASSWIAGRLLAPVRRLSDTARTITDGDLGRRIEVTGHDDLTDLQITFNEMLDRVEQAFVAQRDLLDDAAHELRTPLTILRGHLEVLDPSDAGEVAQTRELLLDEADRMARLVNDLLVLAKARRPDFVRPAATDVEQLTVGVVDRARSLAARTWVLDSVTRDTVLLDAQRITQAVLQLCDNAVKHTAEGDEIGIGSRRHEGAVELWVRDTGPGVDPAVRGQLFDRFVQGDEEQQHGGFGLGLSIVRAIADAHGGHVVLDDTDPEDGGTGVGATVRVRLPLGGVL